MKRVLQVQKQINKTNPRKVIFVDKVTAIYDTTNLNKFKCPHSQLLENQDNSDCWLGGVSMKSITKDISTLHWVYAMVTTYKVVFLVYDTRA